MTTRSSFLPLLFRPRSWLALCSSLVACTAAPSSDVPESDAIVSDAATLLDFKLTTEVVALETEDPNIAMRKQLLYLQGHLSRMRQSGVQLARLQAQILSRKPMADGRVLLRYSVSVPVAWNNDYSPPPSYSFVAPRDISRLDHFEYVYDGKCGQKSSVSGSFWDSFDATTTTCKPKADDVVRVTTTQVAPSSLRTLGKYPEYDKIWSDGALQVVAVFGMVGDVSLDSDEEDTAYGESQAFIDKVRSALRAPSLTEGKKSSSIARLRTLRGTRKVFGAERNVTVTVINIDQVSSVGHDFDTLYNELSPTADILMFNGHSGYGRHVLSFGKRGVVKRGQYQVMLLDACATYSILDPLFFERRKEANGLAADPNGTKFLDIVTNAKDGSVDAQDEMSTPLVMAALEADTPRSWAAIAKSLPAENVPAILGEEDNTFRPAR